MRILWQLKCINKFCIHTNDAAVDFVREAVLFARSIIELVMGEVEEAFRGLVTEIEFDLGDGEDWARIEEDREDVTVMEFDLRL